MVAFYEASRTKLAYVRHDETHVYKGEACKEYTIGSVMHGGCALGLVMSALLNHQRSTAHPDPAHVSAQYLSATTAGPVEILVKNVSVSNRWTRVEASMWQNGTERLRTHSQFADLPPSDDPKARGEPSRDNMNVLPETNSPYARWCPMTVPPGASKREELFKGANFKEYVRWSEYVPVEDTAPEGRKKLEWAAWLELKDARDARKARDEDPRVMAILATFAADMFRNGIELLPEHQSPGSSWYPTLSMSIEMKTKFPLPSDGYATETVGMYSVSHFISEGRHDQTVEVWSAPTPIESDERTPDEWRREAKILAVSTQMALVVPFSVNKSRM